jgi:hypothetical protein
MGIGIDDNGGMHAQWMYLPTDIYPWNQMYMRAHTSGLTPYMEIWIYFDIYIYGLVPMDAPLDSFDHTHCAAVHGHLDILTWWAHIIPMDVNYLHLFVPMQPKKGHLLVILNVPWNKDQIISCEPTHSS